MSGLRPESAKGDTHSFQVLLGLGLPTRRETTGSGNLIDSSNIYFVLVVKVCPGFLVPFKPTSAARCSYRTSFISSLELACILKMQISISFFVVGGCCNNVRTGVKNPE